LAEMVRQAEDHSVDRIRAEA